MRRAGGRVRAVLVTGLVLLVGAAAVAGAVLSRPIVPDAAEVGTPLVRTGSAAEQQELERLLAGSEADAAVVLRDGALVAAAGRVDERFAVASVRKSVIGALYGIAVARGLVDLDATLADLGIDESSAPLTAVERSATVRDLLRARSGVYREALGETPAMRTGRPARGQHRPGEHFHYGNWGFNALGTIFEQETGLGLGTAFAQWIAGPTGMQDFAPEHVVYEEGAVTDHRMYRFHLSARDLARFGALYADGGRWRGVPVVPAGWVAESLTAHSSVPGGPFTGYGYLWWLAPREGLVAGTGAGGQFVLVDRGRRTVTVLLTDTGTSPLGVWWSALTGAETPVEDALGVHAALIRTGG